MSASDTFDILRWQKVTLCDVTRTSYSTLPPGRTTESLWNHVTFGEGHPVSTHKKVACPPTLLCRFGGEIVTTCGLTTVSGAGVCSSPSVGSKIMN